MKMKKTISLFLAIINVLALFCMPVQAASVADLSAYALSGYYNKQLNNNWNEVTSSDVTDANGVITSTATYSGTLASGKRVASFQPWADYQGTAGSAAGEYTMHFGFTVAEITDQVRVLYQYRNSGGGQTLLHLSEDRVIAGDSTSSGYSVAVQAPYKIDIFMNIKTGNGYIYVNDLCIYNGNLNASSRGQWREVRVESVAETTDIKLVTTAATGSVYNANVSMADVINAYIDRDEQSDRVKALSSYAVSGYNNKQIYNDWAEVSYPYVTDVDGSMTSMASYSGTLASGKRIATMQPWADKSAIGSNATQYIMHYGFTVNEITSPVRFDHQYRNSSGYKTLLALSDSKVVAGNSLSSGTFVNVQVPYTINSFMNTKTGYGYIYVNDQLIFEGNMNPNSATQWNQLRVFSLEESTDIKFVTSKAHSTLYNANVSIEDVMAAYMNKAESTPVGDETDDILYSGIKNMSAYAVDGIDNKQINNNWANVTINETKDINGVITNTAYKSGELAASQRVASFQPWEKKKGTYTSAAGAYTMHLGFTVNEVSTPLSLAYRFNADKKLISFSNNKVVWGSSMDGGTYINVTAPYTIDIFMNIQTCKGIIFVNGQVLYDGTISGNARFYNSSSDTQWTEVRVTNISAANDVKLVTSKATASIYNDQVIFENVVDYVMNRQAGANTNWLWQIDGMHPGHELMHGAIDGLCNVTGNNTDGYVLQPNSINANNKGFARFFLATEVGKALPQSTGDNVLWHTFEYNPTVLTEGQRIGIRGNNGYSTLMTAYPATDTASAYLSVGGNEIPVSSDKFYKIDLIVNNKDYEYYILIDGKSVDHGTIYSAHTPLWNIFYASFNTSEKMTLRNVKTTLYDSTVAIDTIVDSLRVRLAAPFATDANGYGDFEVENYDCYNADSWRISEALSFSGGKALSVIAENKNEPGNTEDPTLNLSFKANKAGENTYYMWVRHTASVANQSGQNCFLSLTEDGSYNRFTFTAEQNAPQWIRLGSVTVAQGETGFVRVRERQQNHIAFDRYVITTDESFVPTDAYYQISPGSSSSAYKAPAFVNGRTSFEAEDTTYGSPFVKYSSATHGWTYGSASEYSNSSGIVVSSDYTTKFDKNGETAPHIEFNFTPTTKGSKYLWARIRSTTVNKDIAISVNCSNYVQFSPSKADEHYWQLIYVIDGAQANLPINVRMYNVAGGYAIDKFAISESVFDTPSGKTGWTETDPILPGTYSPKVTQSTVTALSHPRIYFKASDVNTVKNALSASENASALSAHNANVARGKNNNFTGALAVVPGVSNNSAYLLGAIEAMALEYALKGDTTAGQKAVSSAMNYVDTVSYAGINSEDLPRLAGNDIAVLSRIYDWCYNLFTAEQRTKLIDRCVEIAYRFELGWPPANLSSVTGYGAEGSLQNYLLTFAIAVADERPDIYNYIVGRIENEFAPARRIMYASGTSLQGTRYGTFRGHHDLTAVLLLNTIGYEKDIYGEGLKDLVNWYIYARRPDGLLFVDGDDTNNGKIAGDYYTVGHMQSAFVIAARLYNDSYIKNEAKKATKNFTEFNYEEGYLSPSEFLAINSPSLTTTEVNGYPLSKFFGTPSGNLIARTGWNNEYSVTDNTAVAYMKTGEVNIGNHQHLDAGNFQLYYKGILANDPVYYNDYSSEYMNMYAKRSVAHNTVLVRDNVSRSLNGHSIADGGQVPVTAPTNASGITSVAKTEAYDFGGDDVNQPDYSYLKADLTKAYNSSAVSDYNRSFMFLNMYDEESPAALVVFDRLNTKNASHKTAWLLHGLNAPQISGSRATFSLNENGYTGKMTNDTLLPANPSITTVEDGYVTAGGTKYSSGYSGEGVNESDGYRIEVAPKSQSTLTYYLNVVQLSDAGAQVVTPTLIENDTFAGAVIKDRVVLFSKSGDLIGGNTSTEYSFNFADSNGYLCKIAVADVTEGTWEVSYSEDGSEYKVMTTAKTSRFGENKGATISFAGMPGYYKLRRVSSEYTQRSAEITTENEIKQLSPGVKVMNDALYVAPRTYTSMSNISAGEYSHTQIIAVYEEHEDGIKELVFMKLLDNFTETDKSSDYLEIMDVKNLPENVVIKTFLLEDMESLSPVTNFGIVKYY